MAPNMNNKPAEMQGAGLLPKKTESNGTTPEETTEQKKAREKEEKKVAKAKEKAEKAATKANTPTPTKPAAAGKKPSNVFDLENVKMLVRPVMKKGGKDMKIIGYACRPLDWGDWKLGKDGKPNTLGTMLLISKDDGERAAMPYDKFEKDFDWQADTHINCRGGQCPK